MADPLASERSMAFAEPPVYSSRDWIQVHTSERPTEPGRWYADGSRFAISLRNLAQNEFVDVNRMSLQFSVVSTVDTPTPAIFAGNQLDEGLQLQHSRDSETILPGVPTWGCPFFSSATVAIPGLGLESFLRTDVESQQIIASRLMCSGAPGVCESASTRVGTFKILGKAYDAGARDACSRSACAFSKGVFCDRTGGERVGTKPVQVGYEGVVTHYSVPLSLFSHLFNGMSSLLPISYFSAGGDLLNFTFQLASGATALADIHQDRPDVAGKSRFYIIDPAIAYTKTQCNNPSVLSAIESLYRGVSSVAIAPGVSAPMAMTLKSVDYVSAYTTVNAPTGAFSLTIPANEPSMRGVLVKFQCNDVIGGGLSSVVNQVYNEPGAVGSQWVGKNAFTLLPKLRNLQIRIGSYRAPLDALSDLTFDPASIPGLNGVNPFDGFQQATTSLDCASSLREAQRLYLMGKHLFSPFMVDDDVDADALSPFWCASALRDKVAGVVFMSTGHSVVAQGGASVVFSGGTASSYRFADRCGPGVMVIPFESFACVQNHRADAFALRGLDLRNITSCTISGEITGILKAEGPGEPQDTALQTTGWSIRGLCAYDRLMTLLPGRIDSSAQFSLLPTGATSVPVAGNPAM